MNLNQVLWRTAVLAVNLTLAACGGESAEPALAETTIGTLSAALNSPIYDRARAYAAAYPKRDGGTWDQWCGSLMWRFGKLPAASARPSAIAAEQDGIPGPIYYLRIQRGSATVATAARSTGRPARIPITPSTASPPTP